ncbi:MAG: transporter substrate-binding domain-containing protein [Lachnospiraceae bacterium]|nr:transporter substrate-binding domain-containing protein [Lachnospiraceae bacterium]
MRRQKSLKRTVIFFLLFIFTIQIISPLTALAKDADKKVIRVGWHEPPYFITDENGRKSGYSYEYQRKVAAYTGWEYEYVEGTWSELMQKLKTGEIDLMSDVSYSEERTKDMLFTSFPMGTEAYYVFVAPDNNEITSDNPSALNGKKVGVTKGSIQKEYFLSWEKERGIDAEIIEVDTPDKESLKLLGTEYDAFVTMDIYGTPETAVPVCKIGSSYFYFAVSKKRPDLIPELDEALNKIQDENKYYDQQLHDKYLRSEETNRYLSNIERKWLGNHGAIRVGYQDNYLAFCAKDPETGALTGALKDYLDYASSSVENARLEFVPIAFETAGEALDALKNGEIDCVFPANLTDYDAEEMDLVMSPAIMRTEMDAVVKASVQKEFLRKEAVTVAVNEGNTNYELFLDEHYPGWKKAYFKDTPTGLNAVAKGNADCVIISNYRYSNISKQCEKLHLTTVYTGVDMDYCFAMREGDTELYSIIARVTNLVPSATIHTALTYYSTEDVKVSFADLVKDNIFLILAVIAVILLVIIILLLRSIRAEKKILEEEHIVKDLNRRVFVDALTSVRNKGGYSDYVNKLQERMDSGEKFDLAIGIFDCNDLKLVNDSCGHDKGDIYLKNACHLICKVYDHSPVFRIGGDEFAVFLMNDDFKNRDELAGTFEERQAVINEEATNKWEQVNVAYSIAVFDPEIDHSVSDAARRADKIMYENKRRIKDEKGNAGNSKEKGKD